MQSIGGAENDVYLIGCYVEGGDWLKNRFPWRTSLGPYENRTGHLNDIWGYWSTDGTARSALSCPNGSVDELVHVLADIEDHICSQQRVANEKAI